MATTVHIPAPLLRAVDRRAASMKVSRNRYIVRALQSSLEHETEWSQKLWDVLARAHRDGGALADTADAMLADIKRTRASRKKPPL